jgi:hypothetical protein
MHDQLLLFEHIKEHYDAPMRSRFMSMTEAEQVTVGRNLVDRIYVTIAEKYNEVDFENIPASKGDITKLPEYANLKASLTLLAEIEKSSNQSIPEIKVLTDALQYLEMFSNDFYMGFVKKNASIIMTYNLLAMSVICGTSLMISVLVDYVNLGNTDSVQVIINTKYRKGQKYLLIDSLNQFCVQARNGAFKRNLTAMAKPAPIQEAVLTSIAFYSAAVFAAFTIIPLIKELIYLFYFSRMKISEAAKIQADLLNANIQSVQASGKATDKMVRIQSWFADKLSKISHVFAFNYEKNERKAQAEAKAKLTQSDIVLF